MPSSIKLHLGCGKRHIPGFVHVDQVKLPHVDYVQDIRDLSNFPDGCASLIYACQVIEYFDQDEVQTVLTEWRRVLDKNGVLRLSVPNFAMISKLYQVGLKLEWFIGTLYGRISDGKGSWVYHKMTYDEETLSALLRKLQFGDIRHWDWRFTEHKHIDDFSQAYFPHMEKERGLLFNLNMEATK